MYGSETPESLIALVRPPSLNGVSNAALRANLKTFERSRKYFQTKKLQQIENFSDV